MVDIQVIGTAVRNTINASVSTDAVNGVIEYPVLKSGQGIATAEIDSVKCSGGSRGKVEHIVDPVTLDPELRTQSGVVEPIVGRRCSTLSIAAVHVVAAEELFECT